VGLKTIPSPTPGHPARTVLARGVRLGDALLIVGRSTHTIGEVQKILVDSFIWALALTLPIALLIGLAMSRAALRRVQAVNETAREIMAGNLTRRVPTFQTGDEIDTLARTVNDMLERIEQLMRNLQQVTSDIAHDLRTPIGRLKQRFERARMEPQGPDGIDALVEHAVTDLDQILDTFNAVLRIAEIEAGQRRARFTEVDLSSLAEAVMDLYETGAEDLGQRLLADISPGVAVTGDSDLLSQMIANLVENALRHTPGGTEIRLGVAEHDGHASLVVADNGPGIPASQRDRVTDRFYRLEQSRTTAGSGLGLALVKAIADLHGAALTLADNEPGLRVTVRF
jgi:signal transduction histidine kinase